METMIIFYGHIKLLYIFFVFNFYYLNESIGIVFQKKVILRAYQKTPPLLYVIYTQTKCSIVT